MGELMPLEEPEDTWIDSSAVYSPRSGQPKTPMSPTPLVLNVNVGGLRMTVAMRKLINVNHKTKLSELASYTLRCQGHMPDFYKYLPNSINDVLYLIDSNEYFIERPPEDVELVSQYYLSGIIHKPHCMCREQFASILIYWSLPITSVAECCRPKLPAHLQTHVNNIAPNQVANFSVNPLSAAAQFISAQPLDGFETVCFGEWRRWIWKSMEEQQTNPFAKVFSFLSMTFIVASLTGLIIGSMPEFQVPPKEGDPRGARDPIAPLVYLEILCVIWFSGELLFRFVITANKKAFLKGPLNMVDAATVIPFYAETCLPLVGVDSESLKRITGVMLVVRTLRVLRVARLFKLARYSSSLQIMGDSFRTSVQELSMMLILLGTGVVFFATILYFLENDQAGAKFDSIPASCWWCVVTMTTVGYGDVVPKSAGGKIVAAIASICGMVVLAFPISMVVEKFATAQEQLEEKKRKSLVPSAVGSINGASGTFL